VRAAHEWRMGGSVTESTRRDGFVRTCAGLLDGRRDGFQLVVRWTEGDRGVAVLRRLMDD
jgi:hypothetical protein